MGGAVEDVVGGDLYQRGPHALGLGGQQAGGGAVEEVAEGDVVLGAVHGRVGGAVDDDIRGMCQQEGAEGLGIGDVQFLDIGEGVAVLRILEREHTHFIAKLTVGTGDQYIHL